MENPSDPLHQEEMRLGSTLQGPDGTKIENGESERKTQANVQERLQYLHTIVLDFYLLLQQSQGKKSLLQT